MARFPPGGSPDDIKMRLHIIHSNTFYIAELQTTDFDCITAKINRFPFFFLLIHSDMYDITLIKPKLALKF